METFIIYLIMTLSSIYVISKINDISVCNIKAIISIIIISSTFVIIKHLGINQNYIIIFYYLSLFCFNLLILHLTTNKSFISTLLLFILNIVSELIISLIFIILNVEIGLVASILVTIMPLLLINIININIFKNIIENSRKYIAPILAILILILYYSIVKNIFIKNNFIIVNCITFCFITIVLIVKNIVKKQEINNLNKQYNESLSTILEYEKIINVKTKMTHEYKNNLLLIKSMLGKKDKKVHDYIETLLETSITKLDNKLLDQMNRIPFKPFGGVLYYKINQAEENNINITLDISNNIKKISSTNIKEKDINDICKLTSIFMDNAIDANKKVKEKEISISMYTNNNELIISIANKFDGMVCNKSSKGKWHGYGLEIAKDIIKKNKKIKNTTEYISNVFIQNIIYKF